MGHSFCENYPAVREIFEKAETIRPGTLKQMFEGDGGELKNTENTQPCLYLADLASAVALSCEGMSPDMLAGFSLGEIPALAFGGAFSYEDGFRLACVRGELMAKAAANNPASMAAVLKLENRTVEEICGNYGKIYPVNYNCPGQLVVSGSVGEMPSFCEDVKKAGGRVIALNVSGGFHSPFMAEAAELFGKELVNYTITLPKIPVYSNFTSEPYAGDPKELICSQISGSVRWEETIRKMAENGAEAFIECGIGGVLQKLVSKIVPECASYCAENAKQAQEILKEVR
jgi:[acyl-carrier-protein] S-malonyltransferase